MTPTRLALTREYGAIAALGALLLALILLDQRGTAAPLGILRAFLGFGFILFVPGYFLHLALFPSNDRPDIPERLALSVGLSLAHIPLLALALDGAGIPLRLPQIAAAETLLIVGLGLLSWWRRRRLPAERRFAWTIRPPAELWADRVSRLGMAIIVGAALLALIVSIGIVALPRPGEFFTEFYILGERGQAADFPRHVTVGEPARVTIGIINREGEAHTYRVEALMDGARVGALEAARIEHNRQLQRDLTFTPQTIGDTLYVEFLLYRDDDSRPYRTLRLWLTVSPPR
jgi:uncharacterized membrane protein